MQADGRGLTPTADDFDVPPPNAPDTRTEGLHDGLFGRETTGKLRCSPPAVGDFAIGVDAPEEALTVPFGHALYSRDLDYVYTGDQHTYHR